MNIDLNICFLLVIVGQMVRSRLAMGPFDEFSRAKKLVRGQNECLLDDQESLALKAYLSPSVLIATALEKFTIYTSQAKYRMRTYSILFRIKKILKYEHGHNAADLFPISDQYSNEINYNSLIMIEKFTKQDLSCHSMDIEPGTDYILFLSAQNTSLSIDKRRQLTYPVRLSILNNHYRSKRYTKPFSKASIFVRMPVFSKFSKPVEYRPALDRELSRTRQMPISLSIGQLQVRNRTLHLECSLVGSNLTQILWLKTHQGHFVHLSPSSKYRIEFFNSKSVLEVVNISSTDTATYTCFTFDYLNGNILNEKVVRGEANVTKQLLDGHTSKLDSDSDEDKQFINCSNEENECRNGGQCLKTNPKYYKNTRLYHLVKTKFCMCKEFYEGPNCEFELPRKIELDTNEIPDELKPLWNSLSVNKNR